MFFIFSDQKRIFKIVRKRVITRRKKTNLSWKEHINPAINLINELLIEIQAKHSFVFKGIKVRNQRTRWGSCSSKGNLNFNYKIVHLPLELARYLIIHELCHLEHLNHSKKFWELVETLEPDYKKLQKKLKSFRLES